MIRLITLTFIFSMFLLQATFTNAAEVEIFGISNETNGVGITADAQTRNGVSGSTLYRIDYLTGQATSVGSIGYHDCSGLDFHPSTQRLYATCLGQSHNPVLLDINISTGEGTEITELQFEASDFGFIVDISFRNDGVLFAYIASKLESYLAILHPDTGLIENLGPSGLPDSEWDAIAFNGILYNANRGKEFTLNTLDQTNGSGTFVNFLTVPPPANIFPIIFSMDKDNENNVFYAALDNANIGSYTFYLATVDVDTGQVGLVGETAEGIQALAVRSLAKNVPTLSEYGLIALAVIILGSAILVLRRRNQSIRA